MAKRVYKDPVLTVEQQLDRAISVGNVAISSRNHYENLRLNCELWLTDADARAARGFQPDDTAELQKNLAQYTARVAEFTRDIETQSVVIRELQARVPEYTSEISPWKIKTFSLRTGGKFPSYQAVDEASA